MKTTTKKPSPLKFFTPIAGMDSVKKATDAVSAAYKAKKDAKAKAATTKTPEGKPSSKPTAPRGPLARAKAKAETSVKTKAPAAKPAPVEGKPNKSSVRTDPSRVAGRKEGKVADAATREAAIKARGGVLLQSKKYKK